MNSLNLQKLNTPNEYANLVRMMRLQYPKHTFIILEGPTELKIYPNYTHPKSEIIVTDGREKAVQTLKILTQNESDSRGVLAILDADFDNIEENEPFCENLLLTDTHDMETMILNSPALEKVLNEFNPRVRKANTNYSGVQIREILLKIGLSEGYLRWVSKKLNLNLSFKHISFSEEISKKGFQIDEARLINIILDSAKTVSAQQLQQELENLKNDTHDPWLICNGHTLVNILAVVLPRIMQDELGIVISDRLKAQTQSNELARSLRLAYEFAFFQSTQLFASIQKWEQANIPYKVLSV